MLRSTAFVAVLSLSFALISVRAAETARGVVFEDRNGNGQRDDGEPGLPGVRVSNQREVTVTDRTGRWELPSGDDVVFFVIKPRGYMPPLNAHRLPQFYYVHRPAGSPSTLKFPGVAPTGPLPASIDFPLRRQKEPGTFKAIFMGDTQPRDVREVGYFKDSVVPELVGTDAAFGVTLGDVVFDDLNVFEPHNAAVALIGIPWWNVIGNHDHNYDVPNDREADETFTRIFGPNYYSFDHGPVHFIALDDVEWGGAKPEGSGSYTAGLDARQLEFVKNDLALVPDRQLVVLMMHIPLNDIGNRGELYRLIEKRRYALSISGHTHWHEHRFITTADGWRGREPHHHIVTVTACGSWWTGAPNAAGIPHATMRDGAPNGYAIVSFDGTRAKLTYKAAGRPADEQMNIMAPEGWSVSDAKAAWLYVNVYDGSERSRVEFRVGGKGRWLPMSKALEFDPSFVARKAAEEANPPAIPPYRKMGDPMRSPHLWKGELPRLDPGEHAVEVRTRDLHGRVFRQAATWRVEP
ncbi:MAG: calcineurin-like phosphoesterase family protein [Verrucomicrobiales bacterium]|nr:calcineurin-like phosphoesterase family protein [Verrucomicrobiales bacterium]